MALRSTTAARTVIDTLRRQSSKAQRDALARYGIVAPSALQRAARALLAPLVAFATTVNVISFGFSLQRSTQKCLAMDVRVAA